MAEQLVILAGGLTVRCPNPNPPNPPGVDTVGVTFNCCGFAPAADAVLAEVKQGSTSLASGSATPRAGDGWWSMALTASQLAASASLTISTKTTPPVMPNSKTIPIKIVEGPGTACACVTPGVFLRVLRTVVRFVLEFLRLIGLYRVPPPAPGPLPPDPIQ